MKKSNELFLKSLRLVSVLFLLSSCTEQQSEKIQTTETLTCDTTVFLKEDTPSSPSCKIVYNLTFLKANQDADSVTLRTNAALIKAIEEGIPDTQTPQEFVQHLKDTLITNYRQDVYKLYLYDLQNGIKDNELPGWYSYEYDINATLTEGKEHIWNYKVSHFSNTGGAHPNSKQKWINVTEKGELLGKEQVFLPNTEAAICELILKQLISTAKERVKTDTITCIQGLQEYGILQMNGLFVPENFLLEKEGIRFLYNPYEIAPYALGYFELSVPYEELNTYLIKH